MSATLSRETELLLEECAKADANEVVLLALQSLDEHVFAHEDLDEETRDAIEEGQRQIDQGLGIPWEEAEERLRARFGKV